MTGSAKQIVRCPQCGANNRVSTGEKTGRRAVCGKCKNPLPDFSRLPVTVTDANFGETVENSPLPVLLDLWAAWCGPCRMIAPIIEELAEELAGRAVVGKLNVDDNQRTAARFNVQSIPTLLILKNGREVGRIVGAQPKGAILNQMKAFV
ncbi:MAG: thioredoxin [Pyrinomonadaceae bacterium]